MSPRDDGTPVPAFQPDLFFLSRTEGRGLVRDLTGRLIDRCSITTLGVWDHDYGALRFDETFVYDSGLRDVLNWTFAPDAQGRMSASEANITAPVRGWTAGADYHLRFKRRAVDPDLQCPLHADAAGCRAEARAVVAAGRDPGRDDRLPSPDRLTAFDIKRLFDLVASPTIKNRKRFDGL
jgi:hypothetical protein